MKRNLLLMLVMLTASLCASAQFPGGAGKPGQMPSIGHIYGKIVDENGSSVSGASVLLMQTKMDTVTKKRKEILLKGFTTKGNGDFDFTELPVMSQLKLKISATGFGNFEQVVSFMPKRDSTQPKPSAGASTMPNFDRDLGNIKLLKDTKNLENVTVVASKPLMKLDIDKKVFNVEKNIVSAGGTGVDVMRNVPSVQVDIDGNVTLRNATPQLYIDGRPTTLTLDQIPSDAIESVEVITNPSAKFDASGGNAGILNIVLKKNKKNGFNGNVRTGVDKRGAVNGGLDLSVRQQKFNFSLAGMINQNKSRSTGTTDRLNLFQEPTTSIFQNNTNKNSGAFAFGRVGLDYFISNRTTLSLSGVKVHGEFKPYELISINTDSLYTTGKISNYSERVTTGKREFNANGLQFGMKHIFPSEGEELTADVNYFSGKNNGDNSYVTTYYNQQDGDKTGNYIQQLVSSGTNRFLTLQTDYVKPFKNIKLETGARVQLRNLTNVNDNYVFNPDTQKYDLITAATSNYENKDNVYAAYLSLSGSHKNFGYKVGLRAESSEYTGTLLTDNSKFSNNYPVSLFPSLFLSQKLKNNQELQFSVTRRVNRPNFFQLIPFLDYSDPLNYTKGNPALKPEFTQSFEMTYSKTFKANNTFMASLYYKKTTDLITRYQQKDIHPVTSDTILVNSYINADNSQSYGAELTSVNTLTKWWDINTNLNIYNGKISTGLANAVADNQLWSWFGKFNSNFKLPAKFSIQLSALYQSKTNLPVNQGGGFGPPGMGAAQSSSQGYIKPSWGIDIAVKKTFLKDAAALTLSFNDIFRTRIAEQYSYSDYFTQTYSRLRDPQMIRLNFSYRFGKMDMNLFKRKNTRTDMQGATDGMQQ